MRRVSRRAFLAGTGALVGSTVLGRRQWTTEDMAVPVSDNQAAALAALGRAVLRHPDSLPNPGAPAGTPDPVLANIEHIVVCMFENHSYDNVLGCLPPKRSFSVGSQRLGDTLDGFTMANPAGDSGEAWNPYGVRNTNPYSGGRTLNAFQMPSTFQLDGKPSQEWAASHAQFGDPHKPCRGFALSASGPVAMGYWGAGFPASSQYGQAIAGLPFTYALAQTFPVADRWFCDVLGQTDPNRRFLIAATSSGMTDDIALPSTSSLPSVGTVEQDLLLATPANGTIFDRLSAFGISWTEYTADYPTGTTSELYPVDDAAITALNYKPVEDFFADCASGSLPSFSLVDMNFGTQSQEDPQDVSVGEAFLARVVKAVTRAAQWETTLLVLTYDEHGGYYDHVPPPVAMAPDAVPPVVAPGESTYDGFCRFGFRVPAIVVSPYAVANGVTHVVHDHCSILAMVERKWNLPAMTYRDANANDLADFLDMAALVKGRPTLESPGPFPPPGPSLGPLEPSSIPPPQALS